MPLHSSVRCGKTTYVSTTDTEQGIITFKLSAADKAELEALAASRERTLSAELRLALKAHLAEARKS
jgi:hypothetical protein